MKCTIKEMATVLVLEPLLMFGISIGTCFLVNKMGWFTVEPAAEQSGPVLDPGVHEITQIENGQIALTLLADGEPWLNESENIMICKGYDTKEVYYVPINKVTSVVKVRETEENTPEPQSEPQSE